MGKDDELICEEEPLDPRIQHELERLNASAVLINKLENELNNVNAKLKTEYLDSRAKIEQLAQKIGYSIERSKAYYELRLEVRQKHEQLLEATAKHERAASVLSTAREIVDVAEQEHSRRHFKLNEAWQEMLNAAIIKVSDSEQELLICKISQANAEVLYEEAQEKAKKQYKLNKKHIKKSKPYYEAMASYNAALTAPQLIKTTVEQDISAAKSAYSQCMINLEQISDEIHSQRKLKLSCQYSGNNSAKPADSAEDSSDTSCKPLKQFSLGDESNKETDSGFHSSESLHDNKYEIKYRHQQTVLKEKTLRGRSKSCATPDSDSTSKKDRDYYMERTVSLPGDMEAAMILNNDFGGYSDSNSSVLDDQLLDNAMSYQNFEKLMAMDYSKENNNNTSNALEETYEQLPTRLSVYQKHYTLERTKTLKHGLAVADLLKLIENV